ncbi:cytotoxic and regulatory T-cell molecule isoform X2 [Dunckerocampus dactyliophorus]|uniref:cytotoxic and regulatory T-cell molecule isoform X2 n=1 Tax=Dunckerocampus dactyliophorus TaxID=161453 RepID=UPI002404CE21|nr:cytotoxic and regulatory T-cell molecule isoform X2 [Dunckerocampus dactyliophorus]
MEVMLKLDIFMLLIQVSLAVWQRVTVRKGQTVSLACPITNAHKHHVDWKNPAGYVMFFNRNKALKDPRYSISNLTESEFTISISNVSFKDGGNYTCSQYGRHIIEKKVELTVLGVPKMRVTKHEGKFVVRCAAEGNHYPPQISWKVDYGPEFLGNTQVGHVGKKYVSMDMVQFQSVDSRVTVKCIVRHPFLHFQQLMDFVKIGQNSPGSTTTKDPTVWNATSIPVDSSHPDMHTGNRQTSPLLVFLVTCLILGLLAVVVFLVLKLRRAHVLWEKENEDSDPSEESGKSKSRQEEASQGQNRRGLFSTAFTQYAVEKTNMPSRGPAVEVTVERTEQASSPPEHVSAKCEASSLPEQTSAQCDMKETEL